jgi:hypothetical protein
MVLAISGVAIANPLALSITNIAFVLSLDRRNDDVPIRDETRP